MQPSRHTTTVVRPGSAWLSTRLIDVLLLRRFTQPLSKPISVTAFCRPDTAYRTLRFSYTQVRAVFGDTVGAPLVMQSKPSVFARIRPCSSQSSALQVSGDGIAVPAQNVSFKFTDVLHNSSQEECFESVGPIVESALSGLNATVLSCVATHADARTSSSTLLVLCGSFLRRQSLDLCRHQCKCRYGQTGSGKTYTLLGSKAEPGVVARTCTLLGAAMAANPGLSVALSMVRPNRMLA